jgi:hypothetical protein
MITLGLSDCGLSDDGLSDGMIIKSDRIDGVLPQGLLTLTLGLAVGMMATSVKEHEPVGSVE